MEREICKIPRNVCTDCKYYNKNKDCKYNKSCIIIYENGLKGLCNPSCYVKKNKNNE